MSYSPGQRDELGSDIEQTLSRQATVCQKVVDTLATDGWKDIIQPLIDRMIIDVVGGKIGDTWVSGKLDRARKEERREFYVGYKQALIDLHSRVLFHVSQLKQIEGQRQEIEKVKSKGYRVPLVEDTKYAVS